MARIKIGSGRRYGSEASSNMDYRVIGGSNMPDSYSMKYGMSADEAYDKLISEANMKMDLGAGGTGLDRAKLEEDLQAINTFIDGHNASQADMISGSDFFKSQMDIAKRQGATERRPAMAALGGGTMAPDGAPLASTSAIGSPPGVQQAARAKAKGGK